LRLTSITPELADELITAHYREVPSDKPHPVKAETVAEFVSAIRNGEWKPRGDPIVIVGPGERTEVLGLGPGTIMDGWHRLNAIIQSGVTIMEYVMVGKEG
jgi:hypothetical protein